MCLTEFVSVLVLVLRMKNIDGIAHLHQARVLAVSDVLQKLTVVIEEVVARQCSRIGGWECGIEE